MQSFSEYILVEQETINRFKDSDLNKSPFSVEPNVRWRTGSIATEFDIVIKFNNIPLAVVEVKRSLQQLSVFNMAKRQIDTAFKVLNCYYGIITDNREFYFCEKNVKEYRKLDFDKMIAILHQHIGSPRVESEQSTIKDIESCLEQCGLSDFIGKIEENDGSYYFKDDEEFLFWKKLLELEKDSPQLLYRYTSLDTVFFLLKNCMYRMNGIVGMNDTSEIDYFDDYCYTSKNKPSYQRLNNLFLSSCSLLYDDLTMWRLYGDDAKGVCLAFEIKPDMQKEFMLQMVSYANEKKKNNKLDLIKELIKKKVVFNDIDKWKHFFKAKDYSIEEEIRLLYINDLPNKRDWLKTNDSFIINPYVEFDINSKEFPLTLTEVMLGPKCPEKETNEEQLKELIRQKNYPRPIDVKTSSIKNYR